MPVYDYLCEEHGAFTAIQPMSAYADPCACPDCARQAPRVMITAPRLSVMDGARRTAHGVNERAAHEPKRSSQHGPGCGCCSTGGSRKKSSGAIERPDGSKTLVGRRPWMISH